MKHEARCFPPLSTSKSRLLILGSMPGIKSLDEQQYYAHPQNQFWKILGVLFDMPVDTYSQRVSIIKKNNLALWDVLETCTRTGSLDTRIDDKSIKVNDFVSFFDKHPAITQVFFNGSKAETEFKKRVLPALSGKLVKRLVFTRLPSTSPAHAGMAKDVKMKAWKSLLQALTSFP